MRKSTILWRALSCACFTPIPAHAQLATAAIARSHDTAGNASLTGNKVTSDTLAASSPVAVSAENTSVITVTGKRPVGNGTARPVALGQFSLSKGDWADAMTGTSALALVKNLPGVTFTSSDAYGLDLSDGFLLVRGFRQNEVAVTFEGIPLNDGTYGSVTGTAPLNIGVTADVGSVQISPGSAHVSTFSNSADGGEIAYSVRDPKTKPALDAVLGYGSNKTIVTGLSVHTGQIGGSGPRLLIGAERISKDKYTKRGTQNALRGNIKLVQDVPWGDFSAYVSYSEALIWGYNNTSFDMLSKLGYRGTDILYPNYKRAVYINAPENADLPCGPYTCRQLAALTPYDTGQQTVDVVGNLAHHFRLSDNLSGSVMGYGAVSKSDIEISDATTPSPSGVGFSSLVWRTRPRRFGGTANLSLTAGQHTLSTGLWVECIASTSRFESFNQPLPEQGPPLRTIGPYDLYGPPFQIANDSRWRTNSVQVYVQDIFKPTDQLTFRAGLKAVDLKTSGGGIGPDHAPNGTLRTKEFFLPQVSIDWHPNSRNSLYLDTAKTTIGYRVSSRGNIGPISSAWAADNQELFDAALPILKPEKDYNLTVGGFHDFGPASVNLDVYYGIVLNRLLNGASGPQFAPVRSVGIVPRSQLTGADAIVTIRPFSFLTVTQSVSVSKFRYRSDLLLANKTIPLKGRLQPGYPGLSFITQIAAKKGRVEAGLSSTIYLKQPFTYSNDIQVPKYWQVNARASYHVAHLHKLPDLVFRLDVNNLLNRDQIGSVGIGGYSVTGDYQTFMRSAPRQLLFTIAAKY